MSDALLIADGVGKSYRMGRQELHVLRGCGLQVRPGEFVAIMGKSGSGKSTLLHILGALDAPTRGEVRFGPSAVNRADAGTAGFAARLLEFMRRQPALSLILHALAFAVLAGAPAWILRNWLPGGWPELARLLAWLLLVVFVPLAIVVLFRPVLAQRVERERVATRRTTFGFVFQFYHLLPELNVLENVLITRQVGTSTPRWFGVRGAAREAALAVLRRVGLGERLRHRPSELSGGERQRVAIARALVHRPQVLFADEPTGNLDAESGASLMKLLKELHDDGQTIVMVTHDPGVAAQADRVLRLEDGVLRQV